MAHFWFVSNSAWFYDLVHISEMVFPEYDVHFIAVNDGVDSAKGDSEFTAIRNIFNEIFAKDASKKIKATWQSKGRSGEHLCIIPPYGYMKDPEDKKRWIVDEEAAAIVQKSFSLCVDGLGPTQIAKWLQQNNVPNPTDYAHEKGLLVCNAPTANPYKWTNETVSLILERIEYLGHTVNLKASKPSFKSKKKVWNNPSEWVIFENTQEAIIEESVFLVVQNIRQARRRPTKMGDMGMFSGLVYCADCGGKMYLCRANHFKPEQEYYICSTYRKDRSLCKTHSIRRVVLEEIVLRNLREAISYVTQYEDDFIQRAAERSLRERDKALAQKKAVLAQSEKRIAELDVIFKRIYEYSFYELRGGNHKDYQDRDYSGKNTDRPKFQELLADIRQGLIRRVVVYELDRISRSILDFATMMELFQQYNVEFVSSTEKFDTSTPMGRAVLNICIVFAQLEREAIQKRVTDAYYSRCQRGFHMSGAAPYGFKLEPTTIRGIRTKMMIPDPDTANIARLMFEMYAEPSTSFGDIARYFAENNILIYGKELKRGFISQRLRNPIYAQADCFKRGACPGRGRN